MCSIIGYCGRGYSLPAFTKSFNETISRGPDDTRVIDTGKGLLGFHRLAIMGLEDSGMQPFTLNGNYVVCNEEIYGFEKLRANLAQKGYSFQSGMIVGYWMPNKEWQGCDINDPSARVLSNYGASGK